MTSEDIAGQRIKAFIERIERLNEETDNLKEDTKEVYAEAKGVGFDVKTIREIVRLRKKSRQERDEAQQLLDLYMTQIGEK